MKDPRRGIAPPPEAREERAMDEWPHHRLLRRLAIGIVIVAVAEFLIATPGMQIRRLPASTDFATYYLAGAQARAGLSPYDRTAIAARGHALGFVHEQFPFLYPPPFALAMQPLARMSYAHARQVWMLLSTLGLLAALAVTALLMRRQAEALGIEDPRLYWVLLAAFVPAALNSTSVHNDIRAGSVGSLLLLAMVAIAWGMMRTAAAGRASAATGIALAVAALVKLAPVALLPYAWWRGARRAAALGLVLVALTMLPALAHWGWGIVPDYLASAILPSLRDEVAPPMNQSLDAFLSRLFVPSRWVESPLRAPGFKRALSAALALGIVILTLRALGARRRAPALVPVEVGAALLAILVLMKLTWVQTLAAMLFVWPTLMLVILRAAERGAAWARRAGLVACAGFFLSSAHLPVLWTALRHGPQVAFTGAHLLGLLLLWSTACFVLRRQPDVAGRGDEP